MSKLFLIIIMLFSTIAGQQVDTKTKEEKIRKQIDKKTNYTKLDNLLNNVKSRRESEKIKEENYLKKNNLKRRHKNKNGTQFLLQGFRNGKPIYYRTFNEIAAATTSTNSLQPNGSLNLSLSGTGMTVGMWDIGLPHIYHQAFKEGLSGPNHVFVYDDSVSVQTIQHM